MKTNIIFRELGLIPYREALKMQQDVFNALSDAKKFGIPPKVPPHIFFCEHPHVYTIGKSGKESNILINNEQLAALGAELFHTDRGGDVTYHGPGQVVCYPVLDLDELKLGTKEFVHLLEVCVIDLLKTYGIESSVIHGATGVWLDAGTGRERKICSLGMKISRGITMHGIALNINTDLSYFSYINPCGYSSDKMTSMQKEKNTMFVLEKVKSTLMHHLKTLFNF